MAPVFLEIHKQRRKREIQSDWDYCIFWFQAVFFPNITSWKLLFSPVFTASKRASADAPPDHDIGSENNYIQQYNVHKRKSEVKKTNISPGSWVHDAKPKHKANTIADRIIFLELFSTQRILWFITGFYTSCQLMFRQIHTLLTTQCFRKYSSLSAYFTWKVPAKNINDNKETVELCIVWRAQFFSHRHLEIDLLVVIYNEFA